MQPIFPNHALSLIILTFSRAATQVLASVCYYSANDSVFPSPNYVTACGNPSATSGTINCCDLSANNICLSNSLCYDPNVNGGAYYLSPCTDRTYTAPECPRYCGRRVDKNELDVVYDYQAELWRCCSTDPDGSANCSNTTNETFDAPAPKNLSVLYPTSASNPARQTLPESRTSDDTDTLVLAPTSSGFTSTPTSSTLLADSEVTRSTPTRSTSLAGTEVIHPTKDATSTPSSNTASSSDGASPNGSGLQPGAIAGIAVGAAAGLGLTAAVGYWLLRSGRRPATSDPGPSDVVLQDQSTRPLDSISPANARMSQASDSGESAITMPPRRFPDRI